MIIGVDIGASKILVGSFSDSENPIETHKTPTTGDFETDLQAIIESIEKLLSKGDPDIIVVGSRGEIKHEGSTITDAKALKWENAPLKSKLESKFDCVVELINDAAAGTLGESVYGAGKGFERFLYLTISTGIGSGFTVGDELVVGRSGLGDMVLDEPVLNENSGTKTAEQLMSGSAIIRDFGVPAYEIKDPEFWENLGRQIALLINNSIVALHPDCVALGGGVSVHFDKFKDPMMKALESNSTYQFELPQIVTSAFPEEAVMKGLYHIATKSVG